MVSILCSPKYTWCVAGTPPDSVHLFRISNFTGPGYHTTLLFSGLGSMAPLPGGRVGLGYTENVENTSVEEFGRIGSLSLPFTLDCLSKLFTHESESSSKTEQ